MTVAIGGVRVNEMRGNHVASLVAWVGAVYTTYLAMAALQPGRPWHEPLVSAAVIQFVMTAAERPIMYGKRDGFTILVLLIDTAINAGGVFPTMRNIGLTPTAAMLADAGIPPDVSILPAVLISLVVGFIIAIAPEALWKIGK